MNRYWFSVIALIISLQAAAREMARPVLLIPGMGGSILRSLDGKYDGLDLSAALGSTLNLMTHGLAFEDPADNSYRQYMLQKYDRNGRGLPIFTTQELLPPYALDPKTAAPGTTCLHNFEPGGLCGIEYPTDFHYSGGEGPRDLLLEHFFNHSALNNYAQLVKFLKSFGYVAGESLFGFSYDWRQSNRNSDTLRRLDDTLAKIYFQNGQKKVTVFSHSLGCMVVKLYTALYPDNARKYIGQWIAAGGPFQGTAGYLLSSFFSGYCLGDLEICGCTARALMVQIPSIFEIMPSKWYEAAHEPAAITATWKDGNRKFTGHDEIGSLVRNAYMGHTFSYQSKKVEWPMSDEAFAWSLGTRDILATATPIQEIEMYVVYGSGSSTPYSAQYPVSNAQFAPSELLCARHGCPQNRCVYSTASCQPQWQFVNGDGVAPIWSASMPYIGLQPQTVIKHEVAGVSHRELIDDQADIYQHFQQWLGLTADDKIVAPPRTTWRFLRWLGY